MNRRNKRLLGILTSLIAGLAALFGSGVFSGQEGSEPIYTEHTFQYETDQLAVHFLDVGNADCIFLQYNEHTMLIDTGEADAKQAVFDYLQSQGIEQIETMILTHPDSDHIGNAKAILEEIGVSGDLYMTRYEKENQTFEKLQKAIKKKKYNVVYPEDGDSFSFGPCKVTFYGPTEASDDSNSMSLVCKLTYGKKSFLFTGDCTTEEERDILKKYSRGDLHASVLKVGHHGSRYSSGSKFLNAVYPDYGIISCSADNSYGHPHNELLERLEKAGIQVYRTDLQGTIVVTCDGDNLKFYMEK